MLDKFGREVPDPKPVAIPAGFKRPETLQEQVARLVRTTLSRQAEAQGFESFEESQDFDIPDDPVDPSTPFEEFFDPNLGRALTPDEFKRYEQEFRNEYLRGQADAIQKEDRMEALRSHVEALRKSRQNLPPAANGGATAPPVAPGAQGSGGV